MRDSEHSVNLQAGRTKARSAGTVLRVVPHRKHDAHTIWSEHVRVRTPRSLSLRHERCAAAGPDNISGSMSTARLAIGCIEASG